MSPALSRDAVAARVQAGDALVVYAGHLLRIPPAWLAAHPGGALAILHFVGRDATDEITAFHAPQTLALVARYSIARVELRDGAWQPLVPPVMAGWVRTRDRWRSDASPALDTPAQILLVPRSSPPHASLPHASLPLPSALKPLPSTLKPLPSTLKPPPSDLEPPSALKPPLSALEPPPSTLSLPLQAQHSHAYRALHKRIVDAGLYNTPYLTGYGPELLRYLLLAAVSVFAYRHSWFLTSALFLGLLWHQLVFTAHDLGHRGVTHNWTIDHLLSILVADCIGGLSIGWWIQSSLTILLSMSFSSPPLSFPLILFSSDPDIEHLPFLAISPVFLRSLWSSFYNRTMHFDRFAKTFLALQHNLFYIIMFFGRFNLYLNSYAFLINKAFDTPRARGGRWAWSLEVLAIVFFWSWFGRALYGCGSWQTALAYLLVSHAVTSPLHIQIVLSHFSMSTLDLGPTESFPHRQLRTTTDVICDDSIAFIHGGLHLQVTHHLFPRLPRHNLRRASLLVKQFAREQGLTYAEFGFVHGNTEVIGVLKRVAEQVKLMGTVADAQAQEAIEKKTV